MLFILLQTTKELNKYTIDTTAVKMKNMINPASTMNKIMNLLNDNKQ